MWKLAHIPQPCIPLVINGHGWTENNGKFVPVWCQGPIIPVDIAEEDDTLESDDDVASLSEEEVLSDDSAVTESDSDEDYQYFYWDNLIIGFLIPKNICIDTKCVTLTALELKLWHKT